MQKVILEFDEFLAEHGLRFEGIVIGGGALRLLEIVNRATKDIDILDPEIPEEIKRAASKFIIGHTNDKNERLMNDWFNNGPKSLCNLLPKGWRDRAELCFSGKALSLKTLNRSDLVLSKLFAFCDRETDLHDLLKMKVTDEELKASESWVKYQDASPLWPPHVEEAFKRYQELRDKTKEKEADHEKDPTDDLV